MIRSLLIAALLAVVSPMGAAAHSGGLNAQGCHAGSQPYHCHRSSSAPQAVAPRVVTPPPTTVPATTGSAISDADIRQALIAESIRGYSGNCPCPYNLASNGSSCGGRSAWSRPGGEAPLCYEQDVTAAMVERYQAAQGLAASAPPAAQGSASVAIGRDGLRAVQGALAARGYSPGPADGLMGPRTRDAIAAFEQARGLPVTGQPTAALLSALAN